MTDNNQELIKKDLTYIIQLNTKTNYKNPAEVQRTHNFALQRNLFKTTLGQRYMKRLEQLINGVPVSNNCVLCNKVLDNSSLVCTSCLTKYKLTPAKQENTKTPLQSENNAEQRGSVTSGQTSAAQHAVNREQNIAARPKAKTKKKIFQKTIIIALAVMVFIGGLISEDSGTSGVDLIDIMGLTESQVASQYGEPDYTSTNELNVNSGFYNEGFSYTTRIDGLVFYVDLTSGNYKLAGISIGDNEERVSKVMQESGTQFNSQEIVIEEGQQILMKKYQQGHYNFAIRFDMSTNKVIRATVGYL